LVLAGLLASLVVPIFGIASAQAGTTVTKTLTVTTSSGARLANALVTLQYEDFSSNLNVNAQASTNSNGQATFTVPQETTFSMYYVEPAAGDVVDAVGYLQTELTASSTDSLQLQRATVVLDVQDPVNAAPWIPHWFYIALSATTDLELLNRSGPFGYNLPLNQAAATFPTGYGTGAMTSAGGYSQGPSDQFRWRGCLSFTGTNTLKSVHFFTDTTCSTPAPVSTNGSIILQSPGYNVIGHLVNPDGTPFSIPSGVTTFLQFSPNSNLSLSTQTISQYGLSGSGSVKSDGTFTARFLGTNAGEYDITITFQGGLNPPKNLTIPIWMNSLGQLSTTQTGSYITATPSSPLSFNKQIDTTATNFSFNPVISGSSTQVAGYFNLTSNGSSSYNYSGYSAMSFKLADGSYNLNYVPDDAKYAIQDFTVVVNGTHVTVNSAHGSYSAADQSVFNLPMVQANFSFASVAPNEANPNSMINWTNAYGDICHLPTSNPNFPDYCLHASNLSNAGIEGFKLTDGNYRMFLKPTNPPTDAETQYLITVTNGVASVTTNTNVPVLPNSSLGIYLLSASVPNFNAEIMNAAGTAPADSGASLWLYPTFGGQYPGGIWPGYQFTVGQNQQGSAYLIDGEYVAQVSASDGSTTTYHVEVANGVSNVVETVAKSGNNFLLPVTTSNFKISMPGSHSDNISNAYYDICVGASVTQFSSCSGYGVGQSLTGVNHLDPGNYIVVVHPDNDTQSFSYWTVNVASDGTVNVPNASQLNGYWVLPGATPNLAFEVHNPTDNSLLSHGWIGLGLEDQNGNVTGWYPNADLNASFPGLTQANLPDGHYQIMVNASDGSLNLAPRSYQLVMSSGVATLTLNGNAVSKNSGRYVVSPSNSNFNFTMTDPTNSNATIHDSWLDLCQDLGQGPVITGNCNGTGVDQNGIGHLNIATGNWYIRVNPGPAESAAPKMYPLVVDQSGNVTVTGVTAPTGTNPWILSAGTPNVTGSFVDSSGNPIVVAPNTNQGVNLQLQEADSNGNWQWVGLGSWRQSSSFGIQISSDPLGSAGTGHFRLLATPQSISNYAETTSAEFYRTSDGKFSHLSISGNDAQTTLTNFNIQLKSPNLHLEVKNPIDNSDLPGGWVSIFKVDTTTGNTTWTGNANISNVGDGLASAYLADGTYQLQVNAQIGSNFIAGLTQNFYQAVVSGNGSSIVITHTGDTALVSSTGGHFVLVPGVANVTGRLLASDGTVLVPGQNQWININVQKQDGSGNWQYSSNWSNTDQNGNFSTSVNAPGTYRLLLQPNGYTNATTSYSPTFTITSANASTFKLPFGDLTLSKPDALIQVLGFGSNIPLSNININVMNGNQFASNAFTGPAAVAAVSFPTTGQYSLQLYPDSFAIQNGFTSKTYAVTVGLNSDGSKSVTFKADPGVGAGSNGAVTLQLGTATIRGTVTLPAPSTSTTVANSQVVPYDVNGNALWQYSTSTTQSGAWSISLPQGVYTIQAQPAYQDVTHGDSGRLGTITVASDGTATLTGVLSAYGATAIAIPLRMPTWSGVVEAPGSDTTPVPFASVCLVAFNNIWNCNQADATGRWAVTAPSGFSTFDSSAQLQIQDNQGHQYANTAFQGASSVNTALGGLTNNSVVIHMLAPNLQVVVHAGGQPASNLNVNLVVAATNAWLGNAQTNSSGIANFNVANLNQNMTAQIDLSGNPTYGSNYAYTVAPIAASSDTVESVTVNLATPNILGIVHAQTIGGVLGAPIPYEWVELDSVDTQGNRSWIGSTSSNSNGQFAFYAPTSAGAAIALVIHANQGGTTNGTDSVYTGTLTNNNNVAVVSNVTSLGSTSPTPTEVVNGNTYYDFALNSPNVTGIVKDSSGSAVANSWIQPFDLTHRVWLNSPNSDTNGNFGLSLPAGTYQLQANPPGYSANNSKSSICQVVVTGSVVTDASANCHPATGNKSAIELDLHSPNLTFTLVSGSTPIANANVNIGYGAWNTWANSDANGQVSLYIDPADIALLNPTLTGSINLNMWLNPPYGLSNLMVNSYCYSGQANTPCQNIPQVTIGSPFNSGSTLALGNITVKGPNTHLQIKTPTGAAVGPGYWVNLESFDTATAQNFKYYGGASTDSNGVAWFNVDTSTATANTVFGVTINPSGNDTQNYTTGYVGDYQQYGDWLHGLSWNQLIAPSTLLAPATPNASITVTSGDGVTVDRYGSVSIQKLNSLGNIVSGSGVGLNYGGFSPLLLAGNSTYRLVAYPNGVAGAPTTCTVTTNTSNPVVITSTTAGCTLGANSALTLTLSLGNVHGVVVGPDNTTPLSGAIVIAEVGSDTSTVVTTSTANNGAFGFNLDATKQYTITVISPVLKAYPTVNVPITPASTSGAEINLQTIPMGS
jgi:hypothetical protein